MTNETLGQELAVMKKLLETLENELADMSIKEEEMLRLLEQNGADTGNHDLLSETKRLRESIAKLLDKRG